jgi:hypothetical protein
MAVAESAMDQSWAVTLVDRPQQAEEACRAWELDLLEVDSMGDTVTASAVAAGGRAWELDQLEVC